MHAVSAVCVVLTSDITIEQTLWVKHAAGAWEAAIGSDSTENGAVLHGCCSEMKTQQVRSCYEFFTFSNQR